MAKVQSVLSDDKNDWEHRVAAVSFTFCNFPFLERFSLECLQSKTKLITTANQNKGEITESQ